MRYVMYQSTGDLNAGAEALPNGLNLLISLHFLAFKQNQT